MARTPNLAKFDQPCTILRRAAGDGAGGRARGQWSEVFETRCRFTCLQGVEQVQQGLATDRMFADVTLRDGPQAREITAADRLRIGSTEYRIDAVVPADRTYRFIRLRVSLGSGG